MGIHNWMSLMDDNTPLWQVTMPGSHDAGVFTDHSVGGSLTKCQGLDLKGQLNAGSRFFDLRAYQSGFGGGAQMKFGHFAEPGIGKIQPFRGRAVGGHFGGGVGAELTKIAQWLQTHPSETVILRFSHIAHAGQVMNAVTSTPGLNLYRGAGNIANATLGSLRGQVIACFDKHDFSGSLNSAAGIVPFQKYKSNAKGGVSTNGLVTCGAYANKKDLDKVVSKQKKHYMNHTHHDRKDEHLLVIYWQQTGGNVEKNTRAGTHAELGAFLQTLVGGPKPNVILHDFVNIITCKTIVEAFNGVQC